MKKLGATAAVTAAVLLGAYSWAHERTVQWPAGSSGTASTLAHSRSSEPTPGPPQSQDALRAGQVAFDRVCKRCHGAEARGDAAPRLVPFSREYDELLGIVREGAGEMPPISVRELPDESVADIVAYLKSL